MNYCSITDAKAHLGNMVTETNNGILQNIIESVSAEIDDYCKRSFGTTTTDKYYDGTEDELLIDDIVSVTEFKLDLDGDGTYEETLDTTDYLLYPYNGPPYWKVRLSDDSDYSHFAKGIRKGVKITGSWGYASSVPLAIKQAALEMTCRTFQQAQGGYGTEIGTPEIGMTTVYQGLSSDIRRKLDRYVRHGFG